MINFFKKVRLKLLFDGKLQNYLKYATGEIILVVIGILIALQINDWNENRKLNGIRNIYYRQILIDLDREIKNVNSRIDSLEKSVNSYNAYKEYVSSENPTLEQTSMALSGVDETFNYMSFNSSTIESLELTGDIKLIPRNLRTELINLRRAQKIMTTVATDNDNVYLFNLQKAGNLGFYQILNGRAVNGPIKNNDIADKIKRNYADIILIADAAYALKNFTEKQKIYVFKTMLKRIDTIRKMIQRELDK